MSRFNFCDCPAGFNADPERHAPDCPGRSGAGKRGPTPVPATVETVRVEPTVQRFWAEEARNIRCVRAEDFDAHVSRQQTEIAELQKFKTSYMEWHDKTESLLQGFETGELGRHRADVLRSRFHRLQAENAALQQRLNVADQRVNELERKAKLYDQLQRGAELLPEGWMITVEVERDGGGVTLIDPQGNDLDYPSNRESMGDEVEDAIEEALAQQVTL